MLHYEDAYTLASLFHLNSEPWNNQAAYDDPHARNQVFKSIGSREDAIDLPVSATSPLMKLVAERASCREFAAADIGLSDLAAILDAGYGITALCKIAGGFRKFNRAVPSAGGRYPIELYVISNHVAGVRRGLYHFNVRDRVLEPLHDPSSIADFVPDLMGQHYVGNASAMIFMAAVFPRTLDKYGPRGYRYILLEAGHVAQNICLRAIELGFATLCVGGFSDHKVNARLRLGQGEGAVYSIAVGHSAKV
jgi:SagB-type dehydrogenase family enzyme